MTTIRKQVFETNSSSTHSVSISKLKYTPEINYMKDHIILGVGEYGWGRNKYRDTLTKLDYLAVEIESEEDERWKFIIDIVQPYYPDCKFELAKEEEKGYIDHQSYGEVWSEIGFNSKALTNYLFNDNSVLYIDNDNH